MQRTHTHAQTHTIGPADDEDRAGLRPVIVMMVVVVLVRLAHHTRQRHPGAVGGQGELVPGRGQHGMTTVAQNGLLFLLLPANDNGADDGISFLLGP